MQKHFEPTTNEVRMQPISFTFQKLSDQARRWDTFKNEGYSPYFGIKSNDYYLRGKQFLLETDHRNLLWIEKSLVPIVVRWRVYMQSFNFMIRHISGTQNVVADWLSRMYSLADDDFDVVLATQQQAELLGVPDVQSPEYYLEQVHGGRNLHRGIRATWLALNKYFPGHNIPFRVVTEFVMNCPRCQKDRPGMTNNIQPLTLHLKPPHQRSRIGVDRLTITPADEDGNCNLIVLVEFYTKFVNAYPCKTYDAYTLATALFRHVCAYGLFDELWSDPGSDMTSEVVSLLNSWIGMRHVFSLVDRHESCGVEGTNKQILRHLRALCHDTRMEKKWSHPTVLSLILFSVNDSIDSETGVRPFDAKFGSEDGTYMRLPEGKDSKVLANAWLRNLNTDLAIIREISKKHQDLLVKERTADNPISTEQNRFQPGDFVLYQYPTDRPKPSKLSSPFLGPYVVLKHVQNDVECKHAVMGTIRTFHVSEIKLFIGTEADAKKLAETDADQHMVLRIRSYIGDPSSRESCEFEVEFVDGSIVWTNWAKDLFDTTHYETFCHKNLELFPLLYTVREAKVHIRAIRSQDITLVQPVTEVYFKLRNVCPHWYDTLPMEDKYVIHYVVVLRYTEWTKPNSHKLINAYIPIYDHICTKLDNYFITCYGQTREFINSMVLVDEPFLRDYPMVVPSTDLLSILNKKP
jgi:hypothetical protein